MKASRDRGLAAFAVGLGVFSLVLNAAGLVFAYRNTQLLGGVAEWAGLVWELWPLALIVVGVVVAAAQPRLMVGWGLLTAGFSIQVVTFGGAYGGWSRLAESPAPLAGFATWVGMVATGVFVMSAPLVVTCLPSGRPDTLAARIVARMSWTLGAVLVGWWGCGGELLSVNTMSRDSSGLPGLESPVVAIHLSRPVTGAVTMVLTISLVVCFVVAIILLLIRRRRAAAVERAQLRWLAAGLLVLPIVAILTTLLTGFAHGVWVDFLYTLSLVIGLGAIPVSIAVSVLKFRLFAIDRLISRTVVFAIVALVLGVTYAALAVLPFTLVARLRAGDTPSWVVAASTLAAASLFSPLRRRVQRVVNRRFNRSRYDAERVVARFASQVREFTDVGTITSGLTGAVQGALQPAGVTVWVREGP